MLSSTDASIMPAARPSSIVNLKSLRPLEQRRAVIAVHLGGKANAVTAFWAMSYFWLRLAHAVVYLLGIPYVRTLIFTLGYVAVVGTFWELIK